MIRSYLSLLFIFFTATSMAAEKELHFWQFWPEEWMKPAIEEFEKKHQVDVVLERLTWSEGRNKIITAMAANQAPDVIEIGSTWVAGLSNDGGLKAIDAQDLKEVLSSWQAAIFKNKIYALPWTVSTQALFYNKKLLKQAGIKNEPQTWDELLKYSTQIHALSDLVYGYGLKGGSYSTWQKFLPFAWSNDARIINNDWKTTGVNTPEFLEAVRFYYQLKQVGLYDDNDVIRSSFQQGKIGFMLDDPGQIVKFKKESPDLEFATIPLPKSPKSKSINFGGAQMLAITKNVKHPELAEQFIRFMVQARQAKTITSKITTLFPADKRSFNDDFYQKEHPELLVFLNELKTATAPFAHPYWIDIQEEFTEALDKVLYEEATVEEAFSEAEEAIIELLNEE